MKKKSLLFFCIAICFSCASIANASTVSVDETALVAGQTWVAEDSQASASAEVSVFSTFNTNEENEKPCCLDFGQHDRWHQRDCEPPATVPLPGSVWLFLGGFIILAGTARAVRVKK